MAYTGSMAKMVWGSTPTAQQPVAVAPTPTPNAAAVTAGTSDLFTFGLPTGYTQKDLGDGRYEMFDTAGNSAGYGYKGVRDAIGELSYKNANAKTTNANGVWTNPYLQVAKSIWTDIGGSEVDPTGYTEVADSPGLFIKNRDDGAADYLYASPSEKMVNQEFSSEDEIKKQLEKYKQVGNYNGVMGDWEALGQVLEGNVAPNPQEWGNLPTDQKEQIVKGEGILYGSTPVFSKDGQLLGYRTDLTPNEAKDWSNGTDKLVQKDFGTFITHGGKSHSWSNANWRELSDPTAWQTNAVVGDGGTAFIPKGNEDKLSWTNKDSYAHQDTKNSFFGAVFDALDPIIDKLDPGHNWTQDQIKNLVGADSQKAAFEKVVPVVLAVVSWYFGGTVAAAASGANAANAASKGDALGTVLNAISGLGASGVLDSFMAGAGDAAKEVATAAGMSSDTQTALSTMAKGFMDGDLYKMTNKVIDLGGTANKVVGGAVSTAVKTAIKAGVSGAELEDVMKSALVGAMTSLVGGAVGVGTQQATGSGVLGTVAGTVAGNLTGSAIKDATADTPDQVSRPTTQKPTVTAPTLSNKYTGQTARMIWS